jgi:alkyl sulfatase BDS1-like metallo-beta-lactamase superfamily hydrolase
MKSLRCGSIFPIIAAAAVFLLSACSKSEPPAVEKPGAGADLAAHSAEFKREVIKVTDGVYVAVGFGLANSVLLVGEGGRIVIDTMESTEAARPVKEAFDRISSAPIKAIIFTHTHGDHIFGAQVFAAEDKPEIYAHKSAIRRLNRVVNVVRPILFKRSMRQFGTSLPKDEIINCGIGPFLKFDRTMTPGLLYPTKTFSGDGLKLEIAGIKLELIYAPGETADQIVVLLPEKRVLIAADNYYKTFPNLYAIRGTSYRDVMHWAKSLDIMRSLKPEYLIPCHSRPITGAERIQRVLTNYRDAIQFVHDQTVRGMNMGLTPDELVERVKLPPHLAKLPYLQEYYGTVAWGVRAVFNGYLGWFGGNPTDLFPLSPRARAERMAELAGGKEALLERARKAAKEGDGQWVMELTDHLLKLDPGNRDAVRLRVSALRSLAARQNNSNARNYYLTSALELEGKADIRKANVSAETVHKIPLRAIFESMAVRLDPEKSADTDTTVGFSFPDAGEAYAIRVRRGTAEISSGLPKNPDVSVTMDSNTWKEIAAKMLNPAVAYAQGRIKIDGSTLTLVRFLGLFGE